jgi:hypothetical protein
MLEHDSVCVCARKHQPECGKSVSALTETRMTASRGASGFLKEVQRDAVTALPRHRGAGRRKALTEHSQPPPQRRKMRCVPDTHSKLKLIARALTAWSAHMRRSRGTRYDERTANAREHIIPGKRWRHKLGAQDSRNGRVNYAITQRRQTPCSKSAFGTPEDGTTK